MSWFANKIKLAGLSCLTIVQMFSTLPVMAERHSTQQSTLADLSNITIRVESKGNSRIASPKEIIKYQRLKIESNNAIEGSASIGASKSVSAVSGGTCGGGGNIIIFPGQSRPFLLDRLTLNLSLADEKNPVIGNSSYLTQNSTDDVEIGPLLEKDRPAFEFAHQKIRFWLEKLNPTEASSKVLLQLIDDAINNMSYLRTRHSFKTLEHYKLNERLLGKNPTIETAIAYLRLYGAIISSPVWDKLDVETQAGLLIHEAIRQIQGIYFYTDLSDEMLQGITAQIVDVQPSSKLGFENWISPQLKRYCQVHGAADLSGDPVAEAVAYLIDDSQASYNESQHRRATYLSAPDSPALKPLLQELIRNGVLKE